jgi:thiol-disulfide isomerase/thioredoxin
MKNILMISLFMLFALAACSPKKSELPQMPVMLTNNTSLDMSELEDKTIIVVFQPACDHCQRGAASMEENLEKFKEYEVYFLSNATLQELQQFATTYKLNNVKNIHFGFTPGEYIVENFGSIPTPSLYIYEDGTLQNKFIGETPIENILQVL